jgi:hypothetical protein
MMLCRHELESPPVAPFPSFAIPNPADLLQTSITCMDAVRATHSSLVIPLIRTTKNHGTLSRWHVGHYDHHMADGIWQKFGVACCARQDVLHVLERGGTSTRCLGQPVGSVLHEGLIGPLTNLLHEKISWGSRNLLATPGKERERNYELFQPIFPSA